MSTARASTPTIGLTFKDDELDLTDALHVYVTLKQGTKKVTKKDSELVVEPKRIEFELSQNRIIDQDKDGGAYRIGSREI